MVCLAGPSFHEANRSCAWVLMEVKATAPTSTAASRFCLARRLVAPKHRSVGRSAAKAGVLLVFIIVFFRSFICFSEGKMVFQTQHRDSWCFGHGAAHYLPN